MRCLSVRQPFASRILSGRKRVEYRNWSTRFRGRLAIHAGLAPAEGFDPDPSLPRGAILGTVELVDCRPDPGGGYRWILRDPRRFRRPVPSKGNTGLYHVNV